MIDFGVQNAWSYLQYIIHEYAGQLIGWFNGIADQVRSSY